jgi:hypothetical protein
MSPINFPPNFFFFFLTLLGFELSLALIRQVIPLEPRCP